MAEMFAKISCTYCQEEINGVRVQCCECSDFDICLQCFSVGAEIGPHKNNHSYKIVDYCSTNMFGGRGNWTAEEEMQLLDAVELYGFGNWELVSKYVETRTAEEVKEEYISRYLDGTIGKATWAHLANQRPVLIDHMTVDDGPLSAAASSKLPPLAVKPEEARLLGYEPFQDDYKWEYDPEAEQLVSKLSLDPDEDSQLEMVLKLSIVDMYTRRLKERARRKRIARDYQLVSKYFSSEEKDPAKRPLTDEQKELQEKMKVFAQFVPSSEHGRITASLERERELRHRLSELLRYRSLGLRTQDEIMHYEQHAAFERQQQLDQSKPGSSGYATLEYQTRNGESEETEQSSTEKRSTWLLEEERKISSSCTSATSSGSGSGSSIADSAARKRPESLRNMPQGNLLSENEIQLCTNLNLEPVHYTTLKSLIIKENLLYPERTKSTVPSDSDQHETSVKDVVRQYLSYSGWLPGLPCV